MAKSPVQQQPALSIHSGNGNLRGGGVRPVGSSKSMQRFAQSLEHRMGPVLLLCLATIFTVLLIYGLYHETTRGLLVDFVGIMQQVILQNQQHELAKLTDTETTTASNDDGRNGNGTLMEISGDTGRVPPTPQISDAIHSVLRHRADQIEELDTFRERFQTMDTTLWCLVMLNVLYFVALAFGIIWLRRRAKRSTKKGATLCRMLYIVLVFNVCLLMSAQLFLLLFSLLPNTMAFPPIVDTLFNVYLANEVPLENRAEIVEPIEDGLTCKMEVEHELLERMGLQQKCAPKIKDRLLPSYIVVFLIFVTILPFLFAIFTICWTITIKDWNVVKNARKRIEFNSSPEKRPQSPEEIMPGMMSPDFAGKLDGKKVYY